MVSEVTCGVDIDGIPVMASDHDGTRPCLFTLLDEIGFGKTLPFICCPELLSKLVVTHAASVNDGIWGQHVLRVRKIN